MQIAFAGSIAYDYLMTFPGVFTDHILPDRLDTLSLSFLVDDMTRQRGGIAPNIAYNHALLGGRATIVGAAGRDFDEYRAALESNGVDTSGVKVFDDVFTASFFATTDQNNSQIASFYPGAMARAAACRIADLDFVPDLVVISPDDPDAMRAHVRECKQSHIPYFYDPSQQIVRLNLDDLREGIGGAKYLIVNEYEFSLIEDKLGMTAEQITGQGTVLGVTKGASGSEIHVDGAVYEVAAFPPVEVKDPTGTGDAYRGGFLRGVASGWPWPVAGMLGALSATYCLEQVGTQNHKYSRAEYVARFRQHFDDGGVLDALLE
ncbi:MAG: carbohydrate kinase family protein [Anaerolineales bacterium]